MLHGHAVATGMGWGAFLAMKKGFISRVQLSRVLNLISNMELSLYHPIMDDAKRIYTTQLKIVQKRGGHLCAPVPKGEIGKCGYIQDLTLQEIQDCLTEYRQLCAVYPRAGRGIDAHCADVGLEDPATVGERKVEQRLKETVSENEALKQKLAAMEAEMEILRCKCEDCEDPLNKLLPNKHLPSKLSVPQNEVTPTVNPPRPPLQPTCTPMRPSKRGDESRRECLDDQDVRCFYKSRDDLPEEFFLSGAVAKKVSVGYKLVRGSCTKFM